MGVAKATRSPAPAKARKHISISSSAPLPSTTISGVRPKWRAIASLAAAELGLG